MASVEYPPLGKTYVISYSNGDKDFPILAIKKDPRVDNYKRPDDLSPHPDSTRYPNHVFTGTQPTNTDERVIWVYEILPSPWIPFTRYDDDLGPIQGRRRSVINSGQEATLSRDKRVTYEAREGSAIVSTEIEESWNAGSTDPDAESPFPIKDRDFYDPSRGAVQERRQLRPTTGDEVATLENNNGVITQTSYEAYNEYLSFKIVQTYSVAGPQLVGNATNNEGQLVTVTTQRKASDNYEPPQPSATRTVEVNREDAESLVERIVDTPEVFSGQVLSVERPDPVPQKFRVNIPTTTTQTSVEGTVSTPSLSSNDLSKSEQQVTKFVKRTSTTSRNDVNESTLTGEVYTSELGGGIATVTESYGSDPATDPDTGTVSSEKENLGNDKFYVREVKLQTPLPELKGQNYDDTLDVTIPFTRQFVEAGTEEPNEPSSIEPRDTLHSINTKIDYDAAREKLLEVMYVTADLQDVALPDVLLSAKLYVDYADNTSTGTGSGDSASVSGTVGVNANADLIYDIESGYRGPAEAQRYLFFLPKDQASTSEILAKLDGAELWPIIRPKVERILTRFTSETQKIRTTISLPNNLSTDSGRERTPQTRVFSIPATLHGNINVQTITNGTNSVSRQFVIDSPNRGTIIVGPIAVTVNAAETDSTISATTPSSFPTGRYLYALDVSPYRFGLVRVNASVVTITSAMV